MGVDTRLKASDPLRFTSFLNQSIISQPIVTNPFSLRHLFVLSSDKSQRELLQAQAKTWGLEIILANNIGQGLIRLKEATVLGCGIQLGLVEHHVPDINGIGFVRTCRYDKGIPFFPIILLTPILISLSAEEITQLGIIEQLLPSFSINRLHDTLTHFIPANDYKLPYTKTIKSTPTVPVMADETPLSHTILVVEDSPLNRSLIMSMLKRLGYAQVDTAENGQEALEKTAAQVYDLILMDCQMPILDGYMTAREIRRREIAMGQVRTPIIALTAYALPEHRLATQAADMDDHVTKPVRLATLAELLKRWLGTKQTMQTTTDTQKIDITSSLDLKTIEGLHSIMGEGTYSLLHQFAEYAPVQIQNLQTMLEQGDYDSLRHKAHQFKGESAQIGAIKLAHLCHDLEELAKEVKTTQITDCLHALQQEVEQVNLILKHQIPRILQLDNPQ